MKILTLDYKYDIGIPNFAIICSNGSNWIENKKRRLLTIEKKKKRGGFDHGNRFSREKKYNII